jgi:hypothetical protein
VKLAEPPSYLPDNVPENLLAFALADFIKRLPHRFNVDQRRPDPVRKGGRWAARGALGSDH